MARGSRVLALLVGLVLVAVACGGGSSEDASDEAPSNEAGETAGEAADAGEAGEDSSPPAGPWERVEPAGDFQCADGSEFSFWERQADPSNVVFFFQGGGACFSGETCSGDGATSKLTTGPEDDPTGNEGIWDFDSPQNPLADHSFVFVPYCTGDVHLGDKAQEYSPEVTVQHRGFVNGTAALDHLVETFPEAEQVVVAGESAGSIPSPLFAGLVADGLPGAEITVLADGSGAYADEPGVNAGIGELWGADRSIPDWPETEGVTAEEWSIPGLFIFSGEHAPDITFARHDYAFDQVQKTFIELTGLPGGDNLVGAIDDNERQIEDTGVDLRSYTAPGDDHTVLSQDAFYTEEVAGVALVDWVTDLVDGGSVDDVRCEPCR